MYESPLGQKDGIKCVCIVLIALDDAANPYLCPPVPRPKGKAKIVSS